MSILGLTCLVAFIICLLFAQQSGIYWVSLFDNFAGSVPLLTIGLFEMIAVVYVYGIDRLVPTQSINMYNMCFQMYRLCNIMHFMLSCVAGSIKI